MIQTLPKPAGSCRTRWQIVSGTGEQALCIFRKHTNHDTFSRNMRNQLKQVFDALRELMTPPAPPPLPGPVCRDPDDDAVLGLALAAGVDFIVSGDNDLLVLHPFEGIRVLSPVDALLVIGAG